MVGHLSAKRKPRKCRQGMSGRRAWDMLKCLATITEPKLRPATMRLYFRHPTDMPIRYRLGDVVAHDSDHLRNIGHGGLCFTSRLSIATGSNIHIEIPVATFVFKADGVVVWCHANRGAFEVGVQFAEEETDYSVRMVEQVCQIEHYRHEVFKTESRSLTSEQAALEWTEKNAAQYPR